MSPTAATADQKNVFELRSFSAFSSAEACIIAPVCPEVVFWRFLSGISSMLLSSSLEPLLSRISLSEWSEGEAITAPPSSSIPISALSRFFSLIRFSRSLSLATLSSTGWFFASTFLTRDTCSAWRAGAAYFSISASRSIIILLPSMFVPSPWRRAVK